MKNRYDGVCATCGAAVTAGTGEMTGPPWKVQCQPCSGKPKDQPVIVDVFRDGGNIVFHLDGFLDREKFEAFRVALRSNGAVYDGKQNQAKLDQAIKCLAALEVAGFTLNINPDVQASLQAFVASAKTAVASANERAVKVDEALRARGLALFPFQKIGVEWLAGRMRALLCDDMGLGKTIQLLIAIPEAAPVIVVGPEVAQGVWAAETPKWRPDLSFTAINRKGFRWPKPGEVLSITYDSLPEIVGLPADGTVLIADEAHKLKNSKTLRTSRFRAMSGAVRSHGGRVWLATGSPLDNRPSELWAVLQAAGLARDAFENYDQFQFLFDASRDNWGKITWGEPKPEVIDHLRKVMLRREKKEVLTDLPDKMYRQQIVEIGAEWDAKLAKVIDQLRLKVPSVWEWLRSKDPYEPIEGSDKIPLPVEVEEILGARTEIANGSHGDFSDLSHARELLAKAKIPAMIEMVQEFEEQNEPVLVFSKHRAPIDTLTRREGWAVITGDLKGEERQQIASDFQAGKYKGVGLTIDAGGTALTLTRAAQIIFVDRAYNPKLNEQAEDRAARIGQHRGVVVTNLVADHPIDRRLATILAHKRKIIKNSVEAASITAGEKPKTPKLDLPEVDFDKLAEKAKLDIEAAEKARTEAQRIAAERAKEAEELRRKAKEEAEEQKERERKERKLVKARAHAKARGWLEDEDHPDRHPPQTEAERWAAAGLTKLSVLDPDRARDRNDVGFNKSHGFIGHWLSQELPRGLTPKQWLLAIKLCRPYHRQIGECPKETTT